MNKKQLKQLIELITKNVKKQVIKQVKEEIKKDIKKEIREEVQYAVSLINSNSNNNYNPNNNTNITENKSHNNTNEQPKKEVSGLSSKLRDILGENYSDLTIKDPNNKKDKPNLTLRGEKFSVNDNNVEQAVKMQTKDYSDIMKKSFASDKKGK